VRPPEKAAPGWPQSFWKRKPTISDHPRSVIDAGQSAPLRSGLDMLFMAEPIEPEPDKKSRAARFSGRGAPECSKKMPTACEPFWRYCVSCSIEADGLGQSSYRGEPCRRSGLLPRAVLCSASALIRPADNSSSTAGARRPAVTDLVRQ